MILKIMWSGGVKICHIKIHNDMAIKTSKFSKNQQWTDKLWLVHPKGKCVSFNGIDQYAILPSSLYSVWNNLNAGTISLWFNLRTISETNTNDFNSIFFAKQHDNIDSYSIFGTIYSGGTTKLKFQMRNGIAIEGVNAISLDTWHYAQVAWNWNGVHGSISLYLDANLDRVGTISGGLPNDSSPTIMQIGAWSAVDLFTDGMLDELSLFNKSKGYGTAVQLYNDGKGVCGNTNVDPWNDGLLAGYHLDGSADFSGNSHHLDLNGSVVIPNHVNICS